MEKISLPKFEIEQDNPIIYLGDLAIGKEEKNEDIFKVINDETISFEEGDIVCCSHYESIGIFNEKNMFITSPDHILAKIIPEI